MRHEIMHKTDTSIITYFYILKVNTNFRTKKWNAIIKRRKYKY